VEGYHLWKAVMSQEYNFRTSQCQLNFFSTEVSVEQLWGLLCDKIKMLQPMKMQPVTWPLIVVCKRRMQGGRPGKTKDVSHGILTTQNHYLLGFLTLFLWSLCWQY